MLLVFFLFVLSFLITPLSLMIIICNQSRVLMNPFVASNNLYSLSISITYEMSVRKEICGDTRVGHGEEDNTPVYLFLLFLFLLILIRY